MQQRRLDKLSRMSLHLLDLLKENMPHKIGEESGWNFKEAHSILHKVQEIIMFGWTGNFSTQVNNMLYGILYHCSIIVVSLRWPVICCRGLSTTLLRIQKSGWMYQQQGCLPHYYQVACA